MEYPYFVLGYLVYFSLRLLFYLSTTSQHHQPHHHPSIHFNFQSFLFFLVSLASGYAFHSFKASITLFLLASFPNPPLIHDLFPASARHQPRIRDFQDRPLFLLYSPALVQLWLSSDYAIALPTQIAVSPSERMVEVVPPFPLQSLVSSPPTIDPTSNKFN